MLETTDYTCIVDYVLTKCITSNNGHPPGIFHLYLPGIYVLVITYRLGMFYSQLLGGSASFPGKAAAKRAFSRARSVYCSVHFRAS